MNKRKEVNYKACDWPHIAPRSVYCIRMSLGTGKSANNAKKKKPTSTVWIRKMERTSKNQKRLLCFPTAVLFFLSFCELNLSGNGNTRKKNWLTFSNKMLETLSVKNELWSFLCKKCPTFVIPPTGRIRCALYVVRSVKIFIAIFIFFVQLCRSGRNLQKLSLKTYSVRSCINE